MKYTNYKKKKIKRVILATIATNVVTRVGIESYTPGLQKWKGAADILNKKPVVFFLTR